MYAIRPEDDTTEFFTHPQFPPKKRLACEHLLSSITALWFHRHTGVTNRKFSSIFPQHQISPDISSSQRTIAFFTYGIYDVGKVRHRKPFPSSVIETLQLQLVNMYGDY